MTKTTRREFTDEKTAARLFSNPPRGGAVSSRAAGRWSPCGSWVRCCPSAPAAATSGGPLGSTPGAAGPRAPALRRRGGSRRSAACTPEAPARARAGRGRRPGSVAGHRRPRPGGSLQPTDACRAGLDECAGNFGITARPARPASARRPAGRQPRPSGRTAETPVPAGRSCPTTGRPAVLSPSQARS